MKFVRVSGLPKKSPMGSVSMKSKKKDVPIPSVTAKRVSMPPKPYDKKKVRT